MTRPAPARRFAHYDQHIRSAGGTLADSARGSLLAHDDGYEWIDCNGHLTSDLHWVNAHGAPFNPSWMKRGDKFEYHMWEPLHRAHPRLRSARATFRQNGALGLKTEWEVKDLHPLASPANLKLAFERLREDAEAAYGASWRRHVQVKALTNLGGGMRYARKVLRAAHEAGFSTIILPRGLGRLRKIDEPYITWRR